MTPGSQPAPSGSGSALSRPPVGSDVLGNNFDFDWLKQPAVSTALEQWRQGDIVSGLRVFWGISDHGRDPLSGAQLDPQPDGGWVTARESLDAEEGVVPAEQIGIIVSQTCDVVATGPGARHPTVQVAPIVNLTDLPPSRADDVRAGRTVDMVVVTSLQPLGDWAADLRISLPVSKALLVDQQPTRGFLAEQDCLRFSDQVAIKLRRPALHDYVAVDMTNSLEALIRRERSGGAAWMDRVEQIRVRVTVGDRISPQALELIVITIDDPLSPTEKDPLRKWRTGHVKTFGKATVGGKLLPLRILPLSKVSVQDYRESVPLRLDELQQRPFWWCSKVWCSTVTHEDGSYRRLRPQPNTSCSAGPSRDTGAAEACGLARPARGESRLPDRQSRPYGGFCHNAPLDEKLGTRSRGDEGGPSLAGGRASHPGNRDAQVSCDLGMIRARRSGIGHRRRCRSPTHAGNRPPSPHRGTTPELVSGSPLFDGGVIAKGHDADVGLSRPR